MTDSAGVRIVEYTTLEGFPLGPWRAAREEAVRIGTAGDHDAEPPSSFGLAIAVDRQADGSILVADAMAPRGSTGSNARTRIGSDWMLLHETDSFGVDSVVLVPLFRQ